VRPSACNWYYCAHFIAKPKAACAPRFSCAATPSNLGLRAKAADDRTFSSEDMIVDRRTHTHSDKKGSLHSVAERRVAELIPVLGSQPAGDVSHKPGGRLPLLSAEPAVTPETIKRAATNFAAW